METTALALNRLELGQKAQVMALDSKGQERRRMLDLGFVQGSIVEAVHKSPAGDPIACLLYTSGFACPYHHFYATRDILAHVIR